MGLSSGGTISHSFVWLKLMNALLPPPSQCREDGLGLLLEREVTARDNQRLGRRLRQAKLRQNAVVEDTDFRTPRGLDRALFHKLAGCDWIARASTW